MAGHLRRNFQLATVLEVRCDAGGTEAVGTDPGTDAGCQSLRAGNLALVALVKE